MGESRVKNENFITIQGWMVNELNLKGNELLIYALIYGFSQDGEQWFTGSLQYMADWANSTRPGISKTLKKLTEKGLIEKNDSVINGVKFCKYRITELHGVLNKVIQGVKQSYTGCITEFNGGVKQSLTNNIDNNINNNIVNSIKDNKPQKHKYGEYKHVLLTDQEIEKLYTEYGKDLTEKSITFLDEYMEEKGAKYKSCYLAMRRWVFNAVKEKESRQQRLQKPSQHDEWMEAIEIIKSMEEG